MNFTRAADDLGLTQSGISRRSAISKSFLCDALPSIRPKARVDRGLVPITTETSHSHWIGWKRSLSMPCVDGA